MPRTWQVIPEKEYQYRLWGGRRLADVLTAPLPGDGPVSEAWLLSDRDDHQSLVANGPLIANVVFPTGIDRRDDLRLPDRFDVYYGMAHDRIGVARLDLPEFLPPGGVADPPETKV